jgi:transposase-like protein
MTEETMEAATTAAHDDPSSTAPACLTNRFERCYAVELAERILNQLRNGRSLASICRDDGVPAYTIVYGWVLRDIEGFAARYARACDAGGRRGGGSVQYSIELADHIVGEIESGRSLCDVCRDEGMPPHSTVQGWLGRISDFAVRYNRARAIGNPRHGGNALYTDEIADRILADLADGRTLHDICLDDDLPSKSTVYHWVNVDHEGFCARYYQARQTGRCKLGRPTLYTPELAERILHEVADGRSVRDICRADGMPAGSTVRLWVLADRDGFAARFERARRFAHLDMAEELLEIIDDGRNDWMERRAQQGDPAAAEYRETARRSRLRFDGRRWILARELPDIYGNRTAPAAKAEEYNPWADYLKLVDG